MSEIWNLVAMAPPAGDGGGEAPGNFYYIGLMVLMMAVFYMILIRPQRRREQERQGMIGNIKSGDRVVFSGGILGTVANVKEKTFVVKIADKVKIEISRGAVSSVLEKGEEPPESAES